MAFDMIIDRFFLAYVQFCLACLSHTADQQYRIAYIIVPDVSAITDVEAVAH